MRRNVPLKNKRGRKTLFSTRNMALGAMLLALMLVLGYVESLIPIDAAIPGIKLGLSNGVLVFSVYMLPLPLSWLLMIMKVLLSGFLFGNPNAMLYAFSGGVLSLLGMCLLSRVKGIHPVTVSMVGGVLHNVGQVLMAMLTLHTAKLVYYMAVLILTGLACGALCGIAANGVIRHMRHTPDFDGHAVKRRS